MLDTATGERDARLGRSWVYVGALTCRTQRKARASAPAADATGCLTEGSVEGRDDSALGKVMSAMPWIDVSTLSISRDPFVAAPWSAAAHPWSVSR